MGAIHGSWRIFGTEAKKKDNQSRPQCDIRVEHRSVLLPYQKEQ
jgi:hypothetical protein